MKRLLYSYLLLSLGSDALMGSSRPPNAESPFLSQENVKAQIPMPPKAGSVPSSLENTQIQMPMPLNTEPSNASQLPSLVNLWDREPKFKTYFEQPTEADPNNPAYTQDYINWLAKINTVCGFNGKVKLYHLHFSSEGKKILFSDKNLDKNQLTIVAKDINMPIALLDVNHGETAFRAFPCFFNSLIIFLLDGRINICLPGIWHDDLVKRALSRDHLGRGPGWKNIDAIIENWYELFERKELLFLVWFNGELFIVVPENAPNPAILRITSGHWETSTSKKMLLGAGLTAATIAVLYGGYALTGKNPGQALASAKELTGQGASEAKKLIGQTVDNAQTSLVEQGKTLILPLTDNAKAIFGVSDQGQSTTTTMGFSNTNPSTTAETNTTTLNTIETINPTSPNVTAEANTATLSVDTIPEDLKTALAAKYPDWPWAPDRPTNLAEKIKSGAREYLLSRQDVLNQLNNILSGNINYRVSRLASGKSMPEKWTLPSAAAFGFSKIQEQAGNKSAAVACDLAAKVCSVGENFENLLNDPILDKQKQILRCPKDPEIIVGINLWPNHTSKQEFLLKYEKIAAEQLAQDLDQYDKNPIKQIEQDPIIGKAHRLVIEAYRILLKFLQKGASWSDVIQAYKTAKQALDSLVHPRDGDLGFEILANTKQYPPSPTGVGFLEASVILYRDVPIEEKFSNGFTPPYVKLIKVLKEDKSIPNPDIKSPVTERGIVVLSDFIGLMGILVFGVFYEPSLNYLFGAHICSMKR
jgi:hypothetical protein